MKKNSKVLRSGGSGLRGRNLQKKYNGTLKKVWRSKLKWQREKKIQFVASGTLMMTMSFCSIMSIILPRLNTKIVKKPFVRVSSRTWAFPMSKKSSRVSRSFFRYLRNYFIHSFPLFQAALLDSLLLDYLAHHPILLQGLQECLTKIYEFCDQWFYLVESYMF